MLWLASPSFSDTDAVFLQVTPTGRSPTKEAAEAAEKKVEEKAASSKKENEDDDDEGDGGGGLLGLAYDSDSS